MQAVSLKPAAHLHAVNAQTVKVTCSNCKLRELGMSVGVSLQGLVRIDEVAATRRKVKRGTNAVSQKRSFRVPVMSADFQARSWCCA